MSANGCTKRRYPDRITAEIVLANTFRSRNTRREEMRAYRCQKCHGWHLTSRRRAA